MWPFRHSVKCDQNLTLYGKWVFGKIDIDLVGNLYYKVNGASELHVWCQDQKPYRLLGELPYISKVSGSAEGYSINIPRCRQVGFGTFNHRETMIYHIWSDIYVYHSNISLEDARFNSFTLNIENMSVFSGITTQFFQVESEFTRTGYMHHAGRDSYSERFPFFDGELAYTSSILLHESYHEKIEYSLTNNMRATINQYCSFVDISSLAKYLLNAIELLSNYKPYIAEFKISGIINGDSASRSHVINVLPAKVENSSASNNEDRRDIQLELYHFHSQPDLFEKATIYCYEHDKYISWAKKLLSDKYSTDDTLALSTVMLLEEFHRNWIARGMTNESDSDFNNYRASIRAAIPSLPSYMRAKLDSYIDLLNELSLNRRLKAMRDILKTYGVHKIFIKWNTLIDQIVCFRNGHAHGLANSTTLLLPELSLVQHFQLKIIYLLVLYSHLGCSDVLIGEIIKTYERDYQLIENVISL